MSKMGMDIVGFERLTKTQGLGMDQVDRLFVSAQLNFTNKKSFCNFSAKIIIDDKDLDDLYPFPLSCFEFWYWGTRTTLYEPEVTSKR